MTGSPPISRRHHDVGGDRAAGGAIDRTEHADAPWQVEFTATLWALLGNEKYGVTLDEMRRGVEDMAPADYDAMPYYDRQTLSVAGAVVERGYLTWDEINQRIQDLRRRR